MPPSQNGESPKLNLPPPIMETGSSPETSKEANKVEPEKQPSAPGIGNGTKTPVLSNPPVQQIDFSALANTPQPGASSATASTVIPPATADDNDLIEKEWVNKAKKIVEANRDNPYNQSSEITVFKADYMKKRYNKIIKISE